MSNALLAPCLPIMHCIGFTASGIARGSCAALIHSWHGVVAAGSCFARCQSAAASSSICGCITVALCWVAFFISIGFWIFGLPLWITEAWEGVTNAPSAIGHEVSDWITKVWEWVTNAPSAIGHEVSDWITKVWEWVTNAPSTIGHEVSDWMSKIIEFFSGAFRGSLTISKQFFERI